MKCPCGFYLGSNRTKEMTCPGCGTVHLVEASECSGPPITRELVGTAMKQQLRWFSTTSGCPCSQRASIMDGWGADGCEENRETIVDWLLEEAAARHLPTGLIPRKIAHKLLDRAIQTATDSAKSV